jgi:hypothetical protein
MVPVSPDTAVKIQRLFQPGDQKEVVRILEQECENNLPLCEHHDAAQLERI